VSDSIPSPKRGLRLRVLYLYALSVHGELNAIYTYVTGINSASHVVSEVGAVQHQYILLQNGNPYFCILSTWPLPTISAVAYSVTYLLLLTVQIVWKYVPLILSCCP